MLKQFILPLLVFLSVNTFIYAGCGGPYLQSDRGGNCPNGGITYGPGFITGNADTVLSILSPSDTIHFSLESDATFCPPMDSVRWYRDGILIYTAPLGARNYFQYAATGYGTYTCKFNYWGMPSIYSITFSPATAISSPALDEESLSVYPNPSSNGIYTLSTGINEAYTIRILDISGRVVTELKGDQQNVTLDLSSCVPGFYSLVYVSADRRMRVRKLVYN